MDRQDTDAASTGTPGLRRRSFLGAAGLAGATLGGVTATAAPTAAQDDEQNGDDQGAGQCYSLDVDNPYSPFLPGQRAVLEGEEDDERIRVQITVTDATEDVAGVTTRVVEEREWETDPDDPEFDGDSLVEVSRNYVAQTCDGTVWYFGEAVENYEDGEVVDTEGSWRADDADSAPGILMGAWPVAGAVWQQEVAPGIAEDMARVGVDVDDVDTPFDTLDDCIEVVEWNPLEGQGPDDGDEKVFAPGVGLVVDEAIELVEFTPGSIGGPSGDGGA